MTPCKATLFGSTYRGDYQPASLMATLFVPDDVAALMDRGNPGMGLLSPNLWFVNVGRQDFFGPMVTAVKSLGDDETKIQIHCRLE